MLEQYIKDSHKHDSGIAATSGRLLRTALAAVRTGLRRFLPIILNGIKRAAHGFWRHIIVPMPKYIPFYLIVAFCLFALHLGWEPATVISPFNLPEEERDHLLPFGSSTAATALQDAMRSLQAEAAGS